MSLDITERDLLPGEQMAGATEWEDALIKHGIMQGKTVQKNEDDHFLDDIERKEQEDPHEHKSLAQLDELEDDLEEDVLAQYRARRVEELKARARREIYGDVYQIREAEFVKEVSQAPEDTFVVLHLYAQTQADCQVLDQFMKQVASKFRAVKFCRIRAQEAIHNFPASKCPTLLVYKASHIIKQVEGIGAYGGQRMSARSLEWVLAQPITVRPPGASEDVTYQILQTDLTENPLTQQNRLNRQQKGGRRADSSDDDSEDDD